MMFPFLPVAQNWLQGKDFAEGDNPTVVILQATNPFKTGEDISKGIERFLKGNVDAVLSVNPAGFHPYRMRMIEKNILKPFFPELSPEVLYAQRQSLPEAYEFNGAIIVTSRKVILENNLFYGQTHAPLLLTPPLRLRHRHTPRLGSSRKNAEFTVGWAPPTIEQTGVKIGPPQQG